MAYYAQKNYPQIQGISGKYAIASIGCFLTSFANLEESFGNAITPTQLNDVFKERGIYIDVDDNIKDDLNWSSVSSYDGATQVTRSVDHGTTQTAGWPNSNDAIVRFYYRSIQTGQMIFHFCKVADYQAHTIVDSWDGVTKASPYGEPTGWATYSHVKPTPVVPAEAAPAFTIDIQSFSGTYTVKNKKWNIALKNFDDINANPLTASTSPVTFTAKAKRSDLPYWYYLEDANVHQGYNSLDCTPYVPYTAPTGGLTVPVGRTQTITHDLRGYNTATGAGNYDQNQFKQLVPAGTYLVYNTYKDRNDLVNLRTEDATVWAWVNLNEQQLIEDEQARTAEMEAERVRAQAEADAQAQRDAEAAKLAEQAATAAKWEHKPTEVPTPEAEVIPVSQVTVPTMVDTTAAVIASYKKWDKAKNFHFTTDYEVQDILFGHPPVHMEEGQKIGFMGTFTKDGEIYYRPLEDNPMTDNAYGVPVSIFDGLKDGAPWLEPAELYDTRIDQEDKKAILANNRKKYKNTGFDTKEDWVLVETTIKKIIREYGKVINDIVFIPFKKKKGKK